MPTLKNAGLSSTKLVSNFNKVPLYIFCNSPSKSINQIVTEADIKSLECAVITSLWIKVIINRISLTKEFNFEPANKQG